MAIPETPLTRGEQYLSAIAGEETALPNVPLTRTEQYLAKIAGQDVTIPNVPLTRQEQYLAYIAEKGSDGGSGGETINHVQHIHAEDWLTSSNGNTQNFYNTYLQGIPSGALFVAYITNNSATGAGKAFCAVGTKKSPSRTAFWRNVVTDAVLSSYDFFISSGSIIDIYYVVLP